MLQGKEPAIGRMGSRIKRIQWQDKLASKMLKCPYQHIIFTIPHELNYLAKGHPKLLYGVLFKAAWHTIERLARDPENVGGTPVHPE